MSSAKAEKTGLGLKTQNNETFIIGLFSESVAPIGAYVIHSVFDITIKFLLPCWGVCRTQIVTNNAASRKNNPIKFFILLKMGKSDSGKGGRQSKNKH